MSLGRKLDFNDSTPVFELLSSEGLLSFYEPAEFAGNIKTELRNCKISLIAVEYRGA